MPLLGTIFCGVELCLLPILGIVFLVASKISHGAWGRKAEHLFFSILLLATFATCRTMVAGETIWLLHAITLAILIVGSVSIPTAIVRCQEPVRSAQ